MVGFKAKARASAYLTKLGWIRGLVFVGGVCGCVGGGCGGGVELCVYMCQRWIWLGGWGVLEGWECIGGRGKRNYIIISYFLH